MLTLTASQDLDRPPLVSQPVYVESLGGNNVATLEVAPENLHVDGCVFDAVRVGEALQFGDTPLQRHLATLEPGRHVLAGSGALGAAARRLATYAGAATSHPLAILAGSL